MPKYYTVLYSQEKGDPGRITFPVKSSRNGVDGKIQYAGGYPAMFGGDDEDDDGPYATLEREVSEESRRTLSAKRPFNSYWHSGDGENAYWFYSTTTWDQTGTVWDQPRDRNEGEMLKWVSLDIARFEHYKTDKALLERLIQLSVSPGRN